MFDKKRLKIGFIGFGEVASALSQRMKGLGGNIVAYDRFADRVKKRADELGVPLAGSIDDLVGSCNLILSTNSPAVALEVANEATEFLSASRIYCDFNSISPETTGKIQQVISRTGADFVKIAIMAAIPDRGHAVPLLAGGTKARDVAEIFSNLGLDIRDIGEDSRQAAAFKILRSICLKGIVALVYEMIRGAEKYGIIDEVLESASEVMSKASFKDTVNNWLSSTAIHAERRAKEMEEAIETMEALGFHPVMSVGTKKIFEEIAGFDLDELFQGKIPDSFNKVLEKINKQ
jgi:3-hydroxyisobutyrate dehydrogenase-like beta-hydroxyacid dehydrogenase